MGQNRIGGIAAPLLKSHYAPHLVVLIVCFCIIVGALILTPADSRNSFLKLGPLSIPNTCTFKNLTGLPCPGCGLARSIVAAMHGNFTDSFGFHRLGLLTLFYIFMQFLYRLGLVVFSGKWMHVFGSGKILNQGIIVLGILFVLNWLMILL